MDDLDNLLLELQNSTQQPLGHIPVATSINNSVLKSPPPVLPKPTRATNAQQDCAYPNYSKVKTSQGRVGRNSPSPPPPPVPPHPIDYGSDQPLYEPVNLQLPTASDPRPLAQQLSPERQAATVDPQQQYHASPQSPSNYPTAPVSPAFSGAGQYSSVQPGLPSSGRTLHSNIQELDALLADLDSPALHAQISSVSPQNSGQSRLTGDSYPSSNTAVGDRTSSHDYASIDSPHVGKQPNTLSETQQTWTPPPPHTDHLKAMQLANHKHSMTPVHQTQPTRQPQPPQSSATQNLDQLMASLEMLNPGLQSGGNKTAPLASSERERRDPEQLDNIMSNLQSSMGAQGTQAQPKGTCAACNKEVVGQVVTALGSLWHVEHFTCAVCTKPLGTQTFFERDGKPYCEQDYHKLFAPKCNGCGGPITDRCVTAMGASWHPACFSCAACKKDFGDGGFHEKEGKPYCRACFLDKFAPRCGGCSQPIMDNYITAMNKHWHPQCFVCTDCRMPFGASSFFEHEGMPYCERHFHALRGSLCGHCQQPITGRCITAMSRKFHPEHFFCAWCLKQLNKGTFKEHNDKPYCHSCFVKLLG